MLYDTSIMDKVIEPNRVYDVQEAANLLGVSSQTVVEYCRTGKIVSQKIGEWKILGQSLIVFMGINKLISELTPILNQHIRALNDHENRIIQLENHVKVIHQFIDSLNNERLKKQNGER